MKKVLLAAVVWAVSGMAMGQTVVKHVQADNSPFASAVWAGDTLYCAGQLADPVTPADAAKGTPAVYGDTKEQAANVFGKIQKLLESQGLGMKDVVKVVVFMAGDPANGGKMDFAGMNGEFAKFFGTKEQPNKPARSTVQVAALAAPWAMLEVEVVAVRGK